MNIISQYLFILAVLIPSQDLYAFGGICLKNDSGCDQRMNLTNAQRRKSESLEKKRISEAKDARAAGFALKSSLEECINIKSYELENAENCYAEHLEILHSLYDDMYYRNWPAQACVHLASALQNFAELHDEELNQCIHNNWHHGQLYNGNKYDCNDTKKLIILDANKQNFCD